MALCPHCWESLADPVPAVCPKCGREQPLHLEIPDAPTDELYEREVPENGDPEQGYPEIWHPESGYPEEGNPQEVNRDQAVAPPGADDQSVVPGPPTGQPPPGSDPTKPRKATPLLVLVGAIIVVGALAAIPFDVAPRDESGRVSGTGLTVEDQLAVGDCYGPDLELGEAYGGAVTATPCSEPHLWEVVGRLTYPDDAYPGEAAMEAWAAELCTTAITQYLGDAAPSQDIQMWYRFPLQVHWDAGSRLSWCLATRGEPSIGSVRSSA